MLRIVKLSEKHETRNSMLYGIPLRKYRVLMVRDLGSLFPFSSLLQISCMSVAFSGYSR